MISRTARRADHQFATRSLAAVAPLAAALLAMQAAATPLHAQAVAGRVLVTHGEQAIPAVTLTLLNARGEQVGSTVTGPDGSFRLPVRRLGWYHIHASHASYQDTLVGPLQLGTNRVTGAVLRLRPAGFELGAIHAGGDARPAGRTAGRPDPDTQPAGDSVVRFDSAAIAALRVRRLTELLASVRGVRLLDAGAAGGARLAIFGEACVPRIELDGHVVAGGGRAVLAGARVAAVDHAGRTTLPGDHAPDDFAVPARLRLVEVYAPGATLPGQQPGASPPCALIVLRTR